MTQTLILSIDQYCIYNWRRLARLSLTMSEVLLATVELLWLCDRLASRSDPTNDNHGYPGG